nr:MAG TPA: hypothetical protein [Caudoviricetes sp.]
MLEFLAIIASLFRSGLFNARHGCPAAGNVLAAGSQTRDGNPAVKRFLDRNQPQFCQKGKICPDNLAADTVADFSQSCLHNAVVQAVVVVFCQKTKLRKVTVFCHEITISHCYLFPIK